LSTYPFSAILRGLFAFLDQNSFKNRKKKLKVNELVYRLTKDNSIFQNVGFVTPYYSNIWHSYIDKYSMNFIIDYTSLICFFFPLLYFYYSYQYKRIKMTQLKTKKQKITSRKQYSLQGFGVVLSMTVEYLSLCFCPKD